MNVYLGSDKKHFRVFLHQKKKQFLHCGIFSEKKMNKSTQSPDIDIPDIINIILVPLVNELKIITG